jgi:cell division septum initiation protein DivIVA
VNHAHKKTSADLVGERSRAVGAQIGAILGAAEEDAERMLREAHEEAAAIRRRTEEDVAARTAELTEEIDRLTSDAVTDAQSLRQAAERDMAEWVRAANEEASKILAEANAEAQGRAAAAEEAARIVNEAGRRQAELGEAIDALEGRLRIGLEERLQEAHEGLARLSSDLENALALKLSGDQVEDRTEVQQAVT